jgi:hypothetical protein
MKMERPTISTDMASKSSSVAVGERSAEVISGDFEFRFGCTNQEMCRDRDLTSGCLERGSSYSGRERREALTITSAPSLGRARGV